MAQPTQRIDDAAVDSDCEIIEPSALASSTAKNVEKVESIASSSTDADNVRENWSILRDFMPDAKRSTAKVWAVHRQPGQKRPIESPDATNVIQIIDSSDEEDNAVAASLANTTAGDALQIPLGSSPSSCDEGPTSKRRKNADGQASSAKVNIALPKPPLLLPGMRVGTGVPQAYIDSIFRPVKIYLKKHRQHAENFDRQIWRHLTVNLQNDKTFTWKMRVRYMLHKSISEIFPNSHLIAVGSTINGCGAYNSDMDLCLCLNDDDRNTKGFSILKLKKVLQQLKKLPIVKWSDLIPAKVPILKIHFNYPYEELEVDLNINNTAGIYNSYLLHYYSRVDDRCPAMCLAIKNWAKLAGIAEAFNGTFNSYSLILMVVHFLQVGCSPPVLPNLQKLYPEYFSDKLPLNKMTLFGELPRPLELASQNNQTVGELLIGFFNYYYSFDFYENAISILHSCVFPRYMLPENSQRFMMFIEEPFDQQNTARCITTSDCWQRISKAFRDATLYFTGRNAKAPDFEEFLNASAVNS